MTIAFTVVALSLLTTLPAHAADRYEELMKALDEAMTQGDYEKALELAREARPLGETPKEQQLIFMAEGELCRRLQRYAQAREAFQNAIACRDMEPTGRFMIRLAIVKTWDEEGKLAEARAAIDEALKEEVPPPVRFLGLCILGSICESQGDYDGALAARQEILRLEGATPPMKVTAHTDTGEIHIEQGQFTKAIEDFREALLVSDDAGSMETYCGVGEALIGLGRHADGRELLLTCASFRGVKLALKAKAFSLVAKSFREEGMIEEAEQAEEQGRRAVADKLDEALVVKVKTICRAATLWAIGRYYADTDRVEDALATYELIVELHGVSPDRKARALLAIGALHLEQGAFDKAREAFEQIVTMENAPAEHKQKAQAHLDEMD